MSLHNNQNEVEIKNIYTEMLAHLEDYGLNVVNSILRISKGFLSSEIYSLASGNTRLLVYDDNIFEIYNKIIEDYSEVINYYNINKKYFTSNNIQEPLNDIYTVLWNQTNQYNELNNINNPILVEAKAIARQHAVLLKKAIEEHSISYRKDILSKSNLDIKSLSLKEVSCNDCINLTNFIIETALQVFSPNIYSIYTEIASKTILSLNDANTRKQAHKFYSLFKKEYDILNSIMLNHVRVLENKMIQENLDEEQILHIKFIITKIRDIYKNYMETLAGMYLSLHDNKVASYEPETYDAFYKRLKSSLNTNTVFSISSFNKLQNKMHDLKITFQQQLCKEISHYINRSKKDYSVDKNLYLYRKDISETIRMSEDLSHCFDKIIMHFANNTELLQSSDDFEIVSGINDTMLIKMDSITENRENLIHDMNEYLTQFQLNYPTITDEEINKILLQVIECMNNELAFSLYEIFNNNETLQQFLAKILRYVQANHEKFSKNIIAFKKDYLLYEISTYEEIIHYSISKLKESLNNTVLEFVSVCENVYNELFDIMKKNNISIIKPNVHDMFNGKEHEVLMAEKNDLFNKGEVIKVMNSGFKIGDIIVTRANIIAAR